MTSLWESIGEMLQELFSDRKACIFVFCLFILILVICTGIDKVINATVEIGYVIFGYIGSYMQLK
ncbi:MAG: hypothetical protein WB014_14240 [Methanosarcina sp.]